MPKEIIMLALIAVFCGFFYCLALAQNATTSVTNKPTVTRKSAVTIIKAKKVEPIKGKKTETTQKGKGTSIPLKGTKLIFSGQSKNGGSNTTQSFLVGKPLIGTPLKKQ